MVDKTQEQDGRRRDNSSRGGDGKYAYGGLRDLILFVGHDGTMTTSLPGRHYAVLGSLRFFVLVVPSTHTHTRTVSAWVKKNDCAVDIFVSCDGGRSA